MTLLKQLARYLLPIVIILLSSIPTVLAAENSPSANREVTDDLTSNWVEEQIQSLDIESVEQYWERLSSDYSQYFPNERLPGMNDFLFNNGGDTIKLSSVFSGLVKFFLQEVIYNGKLLVIIVMLSVFSMMLETLQTAFERNTISKVAYSITYMVLIIIAIDSFTVAIGYAKSAIEQMISFMLAMIPLLLTLLSSMGGIVTVSIMHPLIIFMIHVVGTVIYTVVFPLLFFSAILHIVSAISDKFKVTHLANMLRGVAVTVLGILLTVFLGVISVQGATNSVTDGVALRTAKFVTGNFIPVVGKMFSDAADTILSASLVAKNAIGLAGISVLLLISAFPAIKIVTLALIYQLAGAVMQPLGDSPIAACLRTIGQTMLYVFAALAAVSFMFFLAITIIITAGNATLMVR